MTQLIRALSLCCPPNDAELTNERLSIVGASPLRLLRVHPFHAPPIAPGAAWRRQWGSAANLFPSWVVTHSTRRRDYGLTRLPRHTRAVGCCDCGLCVATDSYGKHMPQRQAPEKSGGRRSNDCEVQHPPRSRPVGEGHTAP